MSSDQAAHQVQRRPSRTEASDPIVWPLVQLGDRAMSTSISDDEFDDSLAAQHSPPPRATGALRAVINASKRSSGVNLSALTVLSPQNDPYRQDTKAHHRDAQWFADQLQRFVPDKKTIHLRGLHYLISFSGSVLKSDGLPYENNDADWAWLEQVAKTARWLQYVPFERIIDARNSEPMLFAGGRWHYGDSALSLRAYTGPLDTPELKLAEPPFIMVRGGRCHEQPHQIVFVGEKSSLAEVLEPVARQVNGSILLPTGEASDTMIHAMAKRAAADGRPLVVLYFCDFDPAGWQMPVSIARKLQALRDLLSLKLEMQVHHVGLTFEQAVTLELPSIPLKKGKRKDADDYNDLRADNWRETWGREQTEIDAAIALRPAALAQIVRDSVKPFYDPTLERRARVVWQTWGETERQRYYDRPIYAEAKAEIDLANDSVREAHEALDYAIDCAREEQERWQDAINAAIEADPPAEPPIDDVEPDLAPAPEPIFTTSDDFTVASLKLAHRKAIGGEGGE